MSFTVVWIPEAEAELVRLWGEGNARSLIAASVDAMDAALRVNPYDVGESRDGNRRLLIVWPLAVSYVVKDQDRIVQINKVWRYDI